MKFGIFYEHQLPRPWREGDELSGGGDTYDSPHPMDGIDVPEGCRDAEVRSFTPADQPR